MSTPTVYPNPRQPWKHTCKFRLSRLCLFRDACVYTYPYIYVTTVGWPPDSWMSASSASLSQPGDGATSLTENSFGCGSWVSLIEPYLPTPFHYTPSQSEPALSPTASPASIRLLLAIAHSANVLLFFLSRLALSPRVLLHGSLWLLGGFPIKS